MLSRNYSLKWSLKKIATFTAHLCLPLTNVSTARSHNPGLPHLLCSPWKCHLLSQKKRKQHLSWVETEGIIVLCQPLSQVKISGQRTSSTKAERDGNKEYAKTDHLFTLIFLTTIRFSKYIIFFSTLNLKAKVRWLKNFLKVQLFHLGLTLQLN